MSLNSAQIISEYLLQWGLLQMVFFMVVLIPVKLLFRT